MPSNLLSSWLAMPCDWAAPLTTAEIDAAEQRHQLRLPPDLRTLLQHATPAGGLWPDWRSPAAVEASLAWPWEGMRFHVESGVFWLPRFGPRPESLSDALRIARTHYDAAPRLIPVYAHRYIPETPHRAGNPILSVHQTDIIPCGRDLGDWIEREFHPNPGRPGPSTDADLGLWTVIMSTD